MQSINVTQVVKDVNMQSVEPNQNSDSYIVGNDWDVQLQDINNPINNFQEKDMEGLYYPYTGSSNLQDSSWGSLLTFGNIQNSCYTHESNIKNVTSNAQDVGSFSTIYDRPEVELQKQHHNNGLFLSESDLAKLSDLGPDIISLEGSVGSELLKVVDTDDEEDLVVDDTDTESEISISEESSSIVQSSSSQVELYCIVCGLPRSHTVEANFLYIDNAFPLTFVSRTPILHKLVEIIPTDLQSKLNISDNLICKRCFNLIDTAENLEFRLITVKQELCDFVARSKRNSSIITEGNQRNLQNCLAQCVGREMVNTPFNPILSPATQQSELQKHMNPHLTKYNASDGAYIGSSYPSNYMYSSVDSRLQQAQTSMEYSSRNSPNRESISANNSMMHKRDNIEPPLVDIPQQVNIEKEIKNIPCSESISVSNNIVQDKIELPVVQSQRLNNNDKEKIDNKSNNSAIDTTKSNEPQSNIESHEPKQKVLENESSNNKNKRSEENLGKDVSLKKKDKYQCDKCGRTYSQKFQLMNHLNKHNGDFRYKCEHCLKGYNVEMNLVIHQRNHKDLRPHQCGRCPASFISAEELKSHLLFCVEQMFPCDKCTKMFTTSQKLEQHVQTRHEKLDNETPPKQFFQCDVCSKQFCYRSDLANHYMSHNDIKNHNCNICGRAYKHKRHLNRHHKVAHTTGDDYIERESDIISGIQIQELRDKALSGAIRLKSSEVPPKEKTSGNKSVCPICCKSVWKLKNHLLSHSKVKGFRCSTCNVDFKLKQGLIRHIRNKHDKKYTPKRKPSCSFYNSQMGSGTRELGLSRRGVR